MRERRTPRWLLSTRQRCVLELIMGYYRTTGEPCPANYLARRLDLHHSTVQEHIATLHHKGWLETPNPPSRPRTARGV
jgi:DNA-binding IclR family transcriptional regulator